MKKLFMLSAAWLSMAALLAQNPVNDDCAGIIDLGVAPVCLPDVYTNTGATATNIGFENDPTCLGGSAPQRDVWFVFTCSDTLFDYRITLTGVGATPLTNPLMTIYRGSCAVNGLSEFLCAVGNPNDQELVLDAVGLTPNLPYFIRISDFGNGPLPTAGEFTLCVDPLPPTTTIDQGGSSLCSGILYDSGGADGDYQAEEDFTFVICPSVPTSCITFTLDYYNLEQFDFSSFTVGDALTFYDGSDVNAPVLAQISGDDFTPNPFMSGGGGVCFEVRATSGCLTIQFVSDTEIQFEGFAGHWECSTTPCVTPALPVVDTDIEPEDIVEVIATPQTTVTITNIDCAEGAYGTFVIDNTANALGLEKGLVLTSGQADLIIGPNSTGDAGVSNLFPGDQDLDSLSILQGNSSPSNDACIVEMDVFVTTNELTFEYIFGSDEYPEFVNTNFNDIFAFLVSGPGITGDPGLGNAKNIAVLPGGTTPVQINSVNNLLNWQFYRNNELGEAFEYDGLTSDSLGIKKSLTARVDVIPCNTYHLKLAVADRQDFIYDSGVFISEIKGGTPGLSVSFANGIDYLLEDCTSFPDTLVISLSEPAEELTQFIIDIGGTADLGVDYLLNIPPVVVFQPGEQTLSFPITVLNNPELEPTELITISLTNNFGCGTVVFETISIEIRDQLAVEINAGADTAYVCPGGTLQLEANGAVEYFWQPPGLVSNPVIANPTITPTENLWISVTGEVGPCLDVDSVFVLITDPVIAVSALADTNICQGTGVPLQVVDNVNGTGLVWSPADGLDDPNSPTPIATPSATTTYVATVTIAGCSASDSITIRVDTLFFPELNFTEITICQNYPVQLAEVLNTTTTYSWFPSDGLDDATSSGPVALPEISTIYTLTATSANMYCTQEASVTVEIIPADINIDGDPYREICLGDTVFLNAMEAPPGSVIQWSPAFFLSSPTGNNVFTVPEESFTVTATYEINGCLVQDSVVIRVDSLPLSTISLYEDKPIYCPGDTIYLLSKTYEPANFPDITHEWLPFGNQVTPPENWNLVITATETHIYERVTNNRGCVDTARVEVLVGIPPEILVTADKTAICPGDPPVQLQATVNPPDETLEWMADPALSCTDCSNPMAMPFATTNFSVTTPEADCPASAGITIVVNSLPALNVPQSPTICPGDSVLLNSISEPNTTYAWTSNPPGFNSVEATPVITPTQSATYTVFASNVACSTEAEVTVSIIPGMVTAVADQIICFGESIVLSASVDNPGGVFNWTPGNTPGQTIEVTPGATTTYTVTYTYGPDCMVSDQTQVTVLPPVTLTQIEITPDSTVFCEGEVIQFEVTVVPPSANLVWSVDGEPVPGAEGNSITLTPRVEPGQTITVLVEASDANGCVAAPQSASVLIDRCYFIPNAFTPNGDGTNDSFGLGLRGGELEVLEFVIYNRWGLKVFEASPDKPRWDGVFEGEPAPAEVYVYYMTVRFPDGSEELLKGDVTLLR